MPRRVPGQRVCGHALADASGRLATHYAFCRHDYLRRHPHFVPTLLEAAKVIPRSFGADAPLVPEVVTDPEEADPIPVLFALVQTTLDSDEPLDRFDPLGDARRSVASPDGPGTLVVDTERDWERRSVPSRAAGGRNGACCSQATASAPCRIASPKARIAASNRASSSGSSGSISAWAIISSARSSFPVQGDRRCPGVWPRPAPLPPDRLREASLPG